MEKTCKWCGIIYFDITKRQVGKTCSRKCASEMMVETRKKEGSYIRTSEQTTKMMMSMQKARSEGRWTISVEARERLSNKLKKAWASGQMAEKTKQTCLDKYGVEHHTQTLAARKRSSILHTGRIVSVETRKKMSQNARHQNHRFSRCRGGHREDLGMYFRSSWEANYARYLTFQNIPWKYEHKTFDLGGGLTYTPDFELENGSFVEIKGWLTEKGALKLSKFKERYPSLIVKVLQRDEYKKLYKEFVEQIPNWEKVST